MPSDSEIMSVDECLTLCEKFFNGDITDSSVKNEVSSSTFYENQESPNPKRRKIGRLERNERERNRAHEITRLIRELNKVLPNSIGGQRKHQTLQQAIKYIREMQTVSQPARQNSEEVKYQLLKRQFEESAEAVGFFDLGGCVIERNNAFIQRFGYATQIMKLTNPQSGNCAELFDAMAKIVGNQIDEITVDGLTIKKVKLADTFLKVTPSS